MFAVLAQWAARCFGKTKFGNSVSEAAKTKFPLAYFVVVEKPNGSPGAKEEKLKIWPRFLQKLLGKLSRPRAP